MSTRLFRYWFTSRDRGAARSRPSTRASIERLENRVVLSATAASFHVPLAAPKHSVEIPDLVSPVDVPPSTTLLSASSSVATSGQSVTLTAKVTTDIGTAIGTVTFQDGSVALGTATLAAGTAKLITSSLPIGANSITAVYSGSSTATGSTSTALAITVDAPSVTTLSATPTASTYGQPVTFTADVTSPDGTPTGTVEFMERSRVSPAESLERSSPSDVSDLVFDRTIGPATLVDGVATFTTAALTPGVQTIIAVYNGDSDFAGSSSAALTIPVAQVPSAILFQRPPAVGTPGEALSPIVVHINDSFGNTVTTYDSPVTLGINSGPAGGSLGGTLTVNAVNGVATFANITLSAVGSYTLAAASTTLPPATSVSIAVLPATVVPMVSTTAGARIPSINATVSPTAKPTKFTIAISGASGVTLHGPKSTWAMSGEVAFKDLSIKQAGMYTLVISEAGEGPVVESAVVILPGEVSGLSFTQPPATVSVGSVFNVAVKLVDPFGNTVSTSAQNLTLILRSGGKAKALNGTTSVSPVDGIATFTDLSIPNRGAYRLQVRYGQTPIQITSDTFNVI